MYVRAIVVVQIMTCLWCLLSRFDGDSAQIRLQTSSRVSVARRLWDRNSSFYNAVFIVEDAAAASLGCCCCLCTENLSYNCSDFAP